MIEERILNRLAERLARALAPPDVRLARFVVDGTAVGEITLPRVRRLGAFRDVFVVEGDVVRFVTGLDDPRSRTQAMAQVAETLAAEGALTAWRDERYAVAGTGDGPPRFLLERAAARYFGIETYAVHVNGTTTRPDGSEAMWIARRSPRKAIDPGLLDNMIGGGIAAGSSVRATLVKEAREEAGLDETISAQARPAGNVRIHRLQPDGVQRETIFVHDLPLPLDVEPCNEDGEVVAFHLASPGDVARIAETTDGPQAATADAALVMADWLLRRGHVARNSPAGRRILTLARARRVSG